MSKGVRRLMVVGVCVTVAAALAACGGRSSGQSGTSQPTQQQRLVTAMNAFAKCARTHGVPVPDADPNGQIPGIENLQRKYVNTPQGQTVLSDCASQLRSARQLNDAANATDRKGALRFARCMRAHGIPVNDPSPNGDVGGPPQKINKFSPQVRAAAAKCDHFLQKGTGTR
jgi:hypothetical protein